MSHLIDEEHGWGLLVSHQGGESAFPDSESPLELSDAAHVLSEEHQRELEEYFCGHSKHEYVLLPLLSVKRLHGLFCRVDLGGYWSPWVVGANKEEVMEQLDDLYSIYEDYL